MRANAYRHPRRGGALVLALVFMGVVTAGFATWVTVIRQRSRVGDLEEHQARKRLSATNAEVMARDYMMRRVLASNGDPDGLSATSFGGWNNATATSWDGHIQLSAPIWTGYALDSSTRLAGLNGFSPSYDYPYSKSFSFTTNYRRLSYATEVAQFANDTTTWRGFLRSRNPLLGGDLLVIHRPTAAGGAFPSVTGPTSTTPGNIVVMGRVVHFAPDINIVPGTPFASYTVRSLRFTSPTAITGGIPASTPIIPYAVNASATDTTFTTMPWSNLAWTPLSSGNVNGANLEVTGTDWRLPDFNGQLNFIDSAANPSNSLRSELIASNSTLPANGSVSFSDSRGFNLVNTGTSPAGTGVATINPCDDINYAANTDTSTTNDVSDLPSVVISNDLTEMIIQGQTEPNLNGYARFRTAFSVLYTQGNTGRNLTTIRLRNQNSRRMILALKKAAGAPTTPVNIIFESATATAEWHLLILAENVPLTFSNSSVSPFTTTSVRLVGGIETDSPLIFPAHPSRFEINLQTDTRGLIRMTPRLAWVETFLIDKL